MDIGIFFALVDFAWPHGIVVFFLIEYKHSLGLLIKKYHSDLRSWSPKTVIIFLAKSNYPTIPFIIYNGDHRGFQRENMNFQLLVDSFRTSRSQITSVFLSSPRLCLYSIEIKKYQDSVRLCKNWQGKQKKLPIVTVYLEGPSYTFSLT